MPFNGAGVFNRVYSWVQDKANGIFVTASRMDTEMDGMATGLSTCLTKDGQSTPTADIGMGGFKITALAAGVASTDAVRVGQVAALAGSGVFYNAGNSGVAITIDWTNGTGQFFTLTNNATVTIGNGTVVGWYTLIPGQDVTGGRTITWAGTNYSADGWIGLDGPPAVTPTAGATTYFQFYWNGGSWNQWRMGTINRSSIYTSKVSRTLSTQATVAGVSTKVQWDTVDLDTYSEWDIVTNQRWTPKVTGIYLVILSVFGKNASSAAIDVLVSVGGGTVDGIERVAVANVNDTFKIPYILRVTSLGQYVEAFFASVTGAGTITNGFLTYMSVSRIGDAE